MKSVCICNICVGWVVSILVFATRICMYTEILLLSPPTFKTKKLAFHNWREAFLKLDYNKSPQSILWLRCTFRMVWIGNILGKQNYVHISKCFEFSGAQISWHYKDWKNQRPPWRTLPLYFAQVLIHSSSLKRLKYELFAPPIKQWYLLTTYCGTYLVIIKLSWVLTVIILTLQGKNTQYSFKSRIAYLF